MKPQLQIDINKVKKNMSELVKKAHQNNISITGITKGVCGNEDFAVALMAAGVDSLGDSRIENLKKLSHLPIKKILLRSPKYSEIDDVIQYAHCSLNSELKVIEKLSEVAEALNKKHDVILMIDVGDLREGIWYEDEKKIHDTISKSLQMKGINITGIGTNLTCFGGIIPTKENYGLITQLAQEIRDKYNIPLPIISGGNSSSLHMLYDGIIPKGINNLRINQSIFLGREIAYGHELNQWEEDVIRLRAEIIEIQTKPSLPKGEVAVMNAFGKIIVPNDKGIRKRAIVAIGKQDIDINGLKAIDENITVEGSSSDHCIIDVTNSSRNFAIGDWIDFNIITYSGVLSGMASNYIEKVCINET
ncbi:alanine/ornithine racemase family PLP-dependent enzyme [Bacillus sp. NPDC057893]|uniref:alanine/ornithine racemase family PLP-dependent enzyme n=1 Tax=Bacillus sp. NPDC057893 TaxID=3346273 RepID=UPI00366F709C